jgi:hypothetical protein
MCSGIVAAAQTKSVSAPPATGTSQGKTAGGKTEKDSSAEIPASKAVLTVHGLCSEAGLGNSDSSSCSMTVTKQDFEDFLESLRASGQRVPLEVSPALRRTIAQTYVEMMPFEEAAKKAGLDKDATFQAAMKGVRISILSRMYHYKLEKQARKSTPEEIEAYYKAHLPDFEELKLTHVVLPANNPMNLKDAEFHKKAEELINELHDRLTKGEDPQKLEKEGMERLGQNKSTPPAELGPARRGQYSKDQEDQLFALKPGEVTKVINLPSVNVVYKLLSRRMVPLDEARDEIDALLAQQKLEKETKELTESVHADYDPAYFGPAPKSAEKTASTPAKKAQPK